MECKCPNCKGDADKKNVLGVEYIECVECGWFEVQADGACAVCDPPGQQDPSLDSGDDSVITTPPASPLIEKRTPSSAKPVGDGPPPPSPPADVDDDDGLEVTLTDEIDY